MGSENKEDAESLNKLEEYARLQIELDHKVGSLSLRQLLVVGVLLVVLAFLFGAVGEFIPFGNIVASVLVTLAVIGMSNGIRSSNIRKFLSDREDTKNEGTNHD